jgi:hypothetical protein
VTATTRRAATLIAVVTAAALLSGCARDITGTAVTAAGGPPVTADGGAACAPVDAPLADIPTAAGEPQLRIPVPTGWERNTMLDSRVIRFAIVATSLIADQFAPNAVVTLESARGVQEPQDVFEQNRANLVRMMGAADLKTESNTTCGLPSETTTYTAPAMGAAPQRPVVMHAVVAQGDRTTFLATLTLQTTDPSNPAYAKDSREIVDGFQMTLAPK